MFTSGDAGERKGDVIFRFEHILFADEESRQCTCDVPETYERKFVMHNSSVMSLRGHSPTLRRAAFVAVQASNPIIIWVDKDERAALVMRAGRLLMQAM